MPNNKRWRFLGPLPRKRRWVGTKALPPPTLDSAIISFVSDASAMEIREIPDSDTVAFVSAITSVDYLYADQTVISMNTIPISTVETTAYFEAGPNDLVRSLNSGFGGSRSFGRSGELYVAEKFIPGANGNIILASLAFRKFGTPTDAVRFEIRTDASGSPSGTILATSKTDIPAADLSSVEAIRQLSFDPLAVTSGISYWLVAYRTGALDGSNYYAITFPRFASASYATDVGKYYFSGSWLTESNTYMYGIYFDSPTTTPTNVTTISSNEVFAPVYLDSATVSSVCSVASTELANYVDASTSSFVATISTTEGYGVSDAATVSSITSVSYSESAGFYDATILAYTNVITAVETTQTVDAATASVLTTVTATELSGFIEASTIASVTSVSATEVFILAPQHLVPIADIATGGWLASDGVSPLYSMLADNSQSTYIYATAV